MLATRCHKLSRSLAQKWLQFEALSIAENVNVTHLNPGAVFAVAALDPLSEAVNNYCHCHYRPSLNSLRVADIYHVRPGWAGGVTNVSEMNVLCDGRHYLCLTLFFLLRLFPRSSAKTPADGECWRGGSLPRAHTVAPSRPSSKRPRTECLRDTILTQCSSRQADLKHVQMDYSSGLQWYHQFGAWGDFSGTVYCLGASEEAARCPDKMESKSLFQKKKECKGKGGFNCCGSNLVWNILSCLNLWKMTNFYKIRLDVTPGHNATFKSYKSGTLQCDAEKITIAKPHFSTDNVN